MSLFTSQEGKARLLEWYERFAARLTVPTERRVVSTCFGDAHVLLAGPPDGPPLVLLHGALASSAHLLGELEPLARRFRVHAVDVVGQSVKSADAQPSVKNDDYGRWLADVLDGLGLVRVNLLGVSWGGFVSVRFAAVAPERLEKLVLLVPAGLVNGPLWAGFTKVAWPIMQYRRRPSPERLRAAMANMLTTLDDDWLPYLGDALLAFTPNMSIPRLARPEELSRLTAPVLIIGGEGDLSFPGAKVAARARQLFKGPVDVEVIPGCRHSPPTTDEFRARMSRRVADFLLPQEATGVGVRAGGSGDGVTVGVAAGSGR